MKSTKVRPCAGILRERIASLDGVSETVFGSAPSMEKPPFPALQSTPPTSLKLRRPRRLPPSLKLRRTRRQAGRSDPMALSGASRRKQIPCSGLVHPGELGFRAVGKPEQHAAVSSVCRRIGRGGDRRRDCLILLWQSKNGPRHDQASACSSSFNRRLQTDSNPLRITAR